MITVILKLFLASSYQAGYAAALLKAAPPRPITPPTPIKVATQRNGGSVQSKVRTFPLLISQE